MTLGISFLFYFAKIGFRKTGRVDVLFLLLLCLIFMSLLALLFHSESLLIYKSQAKKLTF